MDPERNLAGAPVGPEGSTPEDAARFEAALQAVLAALESDDTEVARLMLRRILAQRPTGDALALAERLVQVVDGRAVMDAVRFELVVDQDPARRHRSRLRLVIETDLRAPARLELAPLVVTRTLSTLDPLGAERWRTDTFLWEPGATLELPAAGATREHVVHTAELPRGELLAVRERWSVAGRSGFVHFEGARLPARAFELEARDKEWLASFLDRGPLDPSVFAAFVDDPANATLDDATYTARLLERTLRVPLDRRSELLDLVAERAPRLDDRQLARLFPALRWLAASTDERDLDQWRLVLATQLGASASAP